MSRLANVSVDADDSKTYYYRGRNGWCKLASIELIQEADRLQIVPVNGRGTAGSCVVQIPLHGDFICKLITEIQRRKGEYEKNNIDRGAATGTGTP